MTSIARVETIEDHIDSTLEEKELGDNLISYVEVLPDDERKPGEKIALVAVVYVPLVETESMTEGETNRTEEMFRNVYGADSAYIGEEHAQLEWVLHANRATPVEEVAVPFYEAHPGIVELHNAQNGGFGVRPLSQRLHDAIVDGRTTR